MPFISLSCQVIDQVITATIMLSSCGSGESFQDFTTEYDVSSEFFITVLYIEKFHFSS